MNKKYILLITTLTLMIPFKVRALTGNVTISCGKTTLIPNSSTTCTLSGYSNEEVSALSTRLSASGNIKISSVSTSTSWQGNGEGGKIELYTDNNKKGSFAIATFKITSSSKEGTGTINVSGTNFSNANFEDFTIGNKSLNITVKNEKKPTPPPKEENTKPTPPEQEKPTESSDATLKSLTLSPGKINFSKNKFEYSVEVSNEVEKITINAIPNNKKAKVTIPKDLSLKVGKNIFEIKVESEDKTVKTYKINVNRLEKVLSNNSKLKDLTIEGYNIEFKNNTKVYNIGDIKEKELKIKTVAEDSKATVKIIGNHDLTNDDAVIIRVEAEDKTTTEYILFVNNKNSVNVTDDKCVETKKENNFLIILILLIISIIINVVLIVKEIKKRKLKDRN